MHHSPTKPFGHLPLRGKRPPGSVLPRMAGLAVLDRAGLDVVRRDKTLLCGVIDSSSRVVSQIIDCEHHTPSGAVLGTALTQITNPSKMLHENAVEIFDKVAHAIAKQKDPEPAAFELGIFAYGMVEGYYSIQKKTGGVPSREQQKSLDAFLSAKAAYSDAASIIPGPATPSEAHGNRSRLKSNIDMMHCLLTMSASLG